MVVFRMLRHDSGAERERRPEWEQRRKRKRKRNRCGFRGGSEAVVLCRRGCIYSKIEKLKTKTQKSKEAKKILICATWGGPRILELTGERRPPLVRPPAFVTTKNKTKKKKRKAGALRNHLDFDNPASLKVFHNRLICLFQSICLSSRPSLWIMCPPHTVCTWPSSRTSLMQASCNPNCSRAMRISNMPLLTPVLSCPEFTSWQLYSRQSPCLSTASCDRQMFTLRRSMR